MADNMTLKQRWQSFAPKQRMAIALGGGCGILLLVAMALTPAQPKLAPKVQAKPSAPVNLELPGDNGHDATIEKLTASIDAVKKDQDKMKDNLAHTEKAVQQQSQTPQGASPETVKELQEMRAELAKLKAEQNKQPSLDDALPTVPSNVSSQAAAAPVEAPVAEQEQPHLRIMVGDTKKPETKAAVVTPKPTVFLPSGSNFEGVLLNGMDAPTNSVAQKNPVPALIRVKSDAILPNRYRYDVRECFIVVSGYGVLSTERAQLQTVVLSCVKTDGAVIETKLEGYVVGEDGKVGLRGRLVSKQGQQIAKSFVAGFASGISQAMAPISVPQLNTAPSGTQQFQTPNISGLLTAGTAQGVSQSAAMLSKFYLDMAKEMFPVVEIDAGRRVTVILVRGVELSMNGESVK